MVFQIFTAKIFVQEKIFQNPFHNSQVIFLLIESSTLKSHLAEQCTWYSGCLCLQSYTDIYNVFKKKKQQTNPKTTTTKKTKTGKEKKPKQQQNHTQKKPVIVPLYFILWLQILMRGRTSCHLSDVAAPSTCSSAACKSYGMARAELQ